MFDKMPFDRNALDREVNLMVAVKINGVWTNVSKIYSKVNGIWKEVSSIKEKIDGVWR